VFEYLNNLGKDCGEKIDQLSILADREEEEKRSDMIVKEA
jgi:hypothetical protein